MVLKLGLLWGINFFILSPESHRVIFHCLYVPVYGHLGCFHILVLVNNAAVNVVGHTYLFKLVERCGHTIVANKGKNLKEKSISKMKNKNSFQEDLQACPT